MSICRAVCLGADKRGAGQVRFTADAGRAAGGGRNGRTFNAGVFRFRLVATTDLLGRYGIRQFKNRGIQARRVNGRQAGAKRGGGTGNQAFKLRICYRTNAPLGDSRLNFGADNTGNRFNRHAGIQHSAGTVCQGACLGNQGFNLCFQIRHGLRLFVVVFVVIRAASIQIADGLANGLNGGIELVFVNPWRTRIELHNGSGNQVVNLRQR